MRDLAYIYALTDNLDSGKILRMSHAYPEPTDIPRFAAQFRIAEDSEDWRDSKYQYTPSEIRAINGHYGWEAFRLKQED